MRVLEITAAAGLGALVTLSVACAPSDAEMVTGGPAAATSAATAAATSFASADDLELPIVRVYKSPTCGCCSAWSEHLKENGFEVELVDTNDMPTVKVALGVPHELGSCHTAEVGDYLVEGHVPADDIKALLAEAPGGVRGLAVPNMPIGSPGMETPGMAPESYDVIAFDEQGGRRVYRSH